MDNILILIKHQLDISSIKWSMRHVGGHMDDEKEWDELDIWEKTNVRADTMAKEALQYWVDSGRQRISTTPVPGTPWTISISGKRITSKIRSEIQYTNQYGHLKSRNSATGANGCINTSNMSNKPDRLDHIRENNEILRR